MRKRRARLVGSENEALRRGHAPSAIDRPCPPEGAPGDWACAAPRGDEPIPWRVSPTSRSRVSERRRPATTSRSALGGACARTRAGFACRGRPLDTERLRSTRVRSIRCHEQRDAAFGAGGQPAALQVGGASVDCRCHRLASCGAMGAATGVGEQTGHSETPTSPGRNPHPSAFAGRPHRGLLPSASGVRTLYAGRAGLSIPPRQSSELGPGSYMAGRGFLAQGIGGICSTARFHMMSCRAGAAASRPPQKFPKFPKFAGNGGLFRAASRSEDTAWTAPCSHIKPRRNTAPDEKKPARRSRSSRSGPVSPRAPRSPPQNPSPPRPA